MSRRTKLINIIGEPGCGKTTLVKEFVAREVEKGSRALIITPDFSDWLELPRINIYKEGRVSEFTGAMRHVWNDESDLNYLSYFTNGLIIFDDCRYYFGSSVDDNIELKRWLIRRRHRQTDIIAVAHGFTEIPPKFFTFCTEIILFKCQDNIKKRKEDLKDYDRVFEYYKRVNEIALTKPHYKEIIKY